MHIYITQSLTNPLIHTLSTKPTVTSFYHILLHTFHTPFHTSFHTVPHYHSFLTLNLFLFFSFCLIGKVDRMVVKGRHSDKIGTIMEEDGIDVCTRFGAKVISRYKRDSV